jgi:hypothetical protein
VCPVLADIHKLKARGRLTISLVLVLLVKGSRRKSQRNATFFFVGVLKLTIWTGGHHIQLSVLDYCPTGAFWSFVDDFLPEMSSAATFQQILPCPMMSLSRHGLEKIVSLKAVSLDRIFQ